MIVDILRDERKKRAQWTRDLVFQSVAEPEQPLIDLQETYRSVNSRNLLEAYHDSQQALDSALNLFSLGYLPLDQRCIAENLFWAICRKIHASLWPEPAPAPGCCS